MKKRFLKLFSVLSALCTVMMLLCFPCSAAAEKTSEDYNDAQLSALIKFFQFEIVLEDEQTKMENYEYAGIDLDLSKPWEYPGVVWNDTAPYSVLSIDFSGYEKLSGKLDLTPMVKLQKVNLSGTEIEWAVLGENSELTEFIASDSAMLSLDFSKCTRIRTIDCSGSCVQQLLLPQHTVETLYCDNNYFTFATLPASDAAKDYRYAPQKDAFYLGIGGINSLELGRKFDFSDYLADDISWFYTDGTPITDYTVEEQIFEFGSLQLDDQVYAVMTSKKFPKLTLSTEPLTVVRNSSAIVWLFFGAILFTFILFFAIRYMNAKKRGDELLTDKYTGKLSDKFDALIANISDKLSRKKGN